MAEYEKPLHTALHAQTSYHHGVTVTANHPDPMPCHVHWPRSYCQSRAPTATICRKPCFRGHTGCIRGRVCSGRSYMRGAQVRHGCAAGVWESAWVRGGGAWRRRRVACVGRVPPCNVAVVWDQCADGSMRGWETRCLPPVRRRACVDAWASAASSGSFRTVAPVAVWGTMPILCGGRVLYGKVPNNTYSQGSQCDSQELNASAGAYRPGSLTDAQRPAVACPPRTPLCVPPSYVECASIDRKVALVVEN